MNATMNAKNISVWFGTRGDAEGIYRATLDQENGELSSASLAFRIKNSGFLAISQDNRRLYSIGMIEGRPDDHNLAAFAVDGESLELINTTGSNGGKPTHVSLSRDEGTLLVAHYSGGGITSLPISLEEGILDPISNIQHSGSSVHPDRQDKPHPHWIGSTPDNCFVLVPDLGMDKVVIYRLDARNHSLETHGFGQLPDGAGPRHLAFHPTEPWAYVINELDLTVTAFSYDATKGALTELETAVALPSSETKKILTLGSEIRMHPNGRFLYAGIRGHDVIAVFRVENSGKLTLVEREPIRGSWPRNFALDPSGRWLLAAGAESSSITVFAVDSETGSLTFTRQVILVPQCICVAFSN